MPWRINFPIWKDTSLLCGRHIPLRSLWNFIRKGRLLSSRRSVLVSSCSFAVSSRLLCLIQMSHADQFPLQINTKRLVATSVERKRERKGGWRAGRTLQFSEEASPDRKHWKTHFLPHDLNFPSTYKFNLHLRKFLWIYLKVKFPSVMQQNLKHC